MMWSLSALCSCLVPCNAALGQGAGPFGLWFWLLVQRSQRHMQLQTIWVHQANKPIVKLGAAAKKKGFTHLVCGQGPVLQRLASVKVQWHENHIC